MSTEPKTADKKVAMNIVNQILDLSGAGVEQRQSINDRCDEFVLERMAAVRAEERAQVIEECAAAADKACVECASNIRALSAAPVAGAGDVARRAKQSAAVKCAQNWIMRQWGCIITCSVAARGLVARKKFLKLFSKIA